MKCKNCGHNKSWHRGYTDTPPKGLLVNLHSVCMKDKCRCLKFEDENSNKSKGKEKGQ